MEKITFKHKGFEVVYQEFNDRWYCPNLNFSSETPKDMRAKIDKHLRDESKFKEMACFYGGGSRLASFQAGKITSVTDDGEFWIRGGKGERGKYKKAYKFSPENESRFKAIEAKREEIGRLWKEIDELESAMEPIVIPLP